MAYRSSTSRRRSRGSVPAWVSIVIVAALILAVGGLSWLAITRTQTPPPTESPRVTAVEWPNVPHEAVVVL